MTTSMEAQTNMSNSDSAGAQTAGNPWENELASLLEELSQLQDQLLDVLSRKRQCMATGDLAGMTDLQPLESTLVQRLEACHQKRTQLLTAASRQGLPNHSLRGLAGALNPEYRDKLRSDAESVSSRMRLLQHQSLANWVVAQKSLLHLAQMLEIIATGGRLKPTYGRQTNERDRGALVDQQV